MEEAFPSVTFVYGNEAREDQGDFALVVCGCPVKCANYKDFQGSLGKFVVASNNDFEKACREIQRAFSITLITSMRC
jgi:hypothetical protein